MTIVDKINAIINWQKDNLDEVDINSLSESGEISLKEKIEGLIEETIPDDLIKLYEKHNGESGNSYGCLFGHRLMSVDEVIKQIEFALSNVKPEQREILDPEKSNGLLRQIVDFYVSHMPEHKLFRKSWYKIEFSCGLGAYQGPYLYKTPDTDKKTRGIVNIDFNEYELLSPIIEELNEIEKITYNWDKLEFQVLSNNEYKVERKDFEFLSADNWKSYPESMIKRKYFNPKWIPIISDSGGNFIGIDLDPDVKGTKGQIIIFGRDEDEMIVVSDSLSGFFDYLLECINDNIKASRLKEESHLHDILKDMIKNNSAQ